MQGEITSHGKEGSFTHYNTWQRAIQSRDRPGVLAPTEEAVN